jgi:hypothetical protein
LSVRKVVLGLGGSVLLSAVVLGTGVAPAAAVASSPDGATTIAAAPAANPNDYRKGYRDGYQDGWKTAQQQNCRNDIAFARPAPEGPDRYVLGYSDGFPAGYNSYEARFCR